MLIVAVAVDGEDDGRAGAGHEPARVGVECAAGKWQSAAATAWSWPHWHPQPRQQLLHERHHASRHDHTAVCLKVSCLTLTPVTPCM